MYIERALEKTVMEVTRNFPVLLITGPRQVGKTTMLKKLAAKDRSYITLDDPMERELAINDPGLFMQRHKPPVIIDEIQYAPNILPYIKMYVDENKVKGDYWLTGSQMFHMMKTVSESLAGRVGIINMLGLSNNEISGNKSTPFVTDENVLSEKFKTTKPQDLTDVFNRIFRGSMPALYENEQNEEQYFASYINTYLQRDIKDLTQVGDEMSFLKFLTACAARTSQMVNYAELANDVGISAPTAKQWLSILVSSGVIIMIEPYFNNALKRIIKAPNMYFLDTGICAYLTRWTNSQSLEIGAMSGAFFETYVISEIVKSYYNAGKRPSICYYRDSDQKEIDLILEQDGILFPIEIKKSGNPGKDAIKNFSILEKTQKPVGTGSVICLSQKIYPIDEKNYLVPVGLI